MAYTQLNFAVGLYALDFDASSTATGQYTAVCLGSATQASGTGQGRAALQRPAAGAAILGILQANGVVNESIMVGVSGISQARISPAAAAGSIGDVFATDVNGMLIKATSGQVGVAIAHENYQPSDITTVRLGNFGKQ